MMIYNDSTTGINIHVNMPLVTPEMVALAACQPQKRLVIECIAPKAESYCNLTPDEDARWVDLFSTMIEGSSISDDAADAAVWQVMIREFPRLAAFDGCTADVAR